ncbi:MAG TPA: M23 family metallopeptidase [Longimicrobiales bacterium]|nr:M23 family metallopeptidase [Longimicrobiales bacterium]
MRQRPWWPKGPRGILLLAGVLLLPAAVTGWWVMTRDRAPALTSMVTDGGGPGIPANGDDVAAGEPFVFTESGMFVAARRAGAGAVVPVAGVDVTDLQNTWGAPRSDDRTHIGIDIPAPRGTPVTAVLDGWIVNMSYNAAGGRGVHLLDRTGRYLLYYAHLDDYAEGLYRGMAVRQRELLGYVGTTGNAETPHLHFEVGRVRSPGALTAEPLNPYHFLRGEP